MKLQFKLIAAALALAAAGTASAQVNGVQNANGTGTDLFFFAYDSTTKQSFVEDLGTSYVNFLPTGANAAASFTTNIAASTAWAQYLSAETTANAALASIGSQVGTTTWGVIAGDISAANYGLMTTVTAGADTTGQTAPNVRGTIGTPLKSLADALNLAAYSTAQSGYFSSSTIGDNIANNFGNNGAGKLKFTVDNAIGQAANFTYWNTKVVPFAPVTYGNANGASTFNFDGTNLSYTVPSIVAAVPEPSSYMMLLAGLLMVGAVVARRRNSAK